MGRTKPLLLYHPYPRHRPCVKGALRRGCHGETPEKRSSDTKCSVPIECETLVSRENHRNESEQASPFIYLTDSRSERCRVTPTHTGRAVRLEENAAAAVFEWARPLAHVKWSELPANWDRTLPVFCPSLSLPATPPHGSHWVRRIPTGSL